MSAPSKVRYEVTFGTLQQPARIVSGHPMIRRQVKDQKTKEIKYQTDGKTPREEIYVAMAVPKTPGVADWKMTEWGRILHSAAIGGFPAGEHARPDFAYKVTDGDSTIPNKKGKKPCDQEGWPGHWIIHCKTEMGVRCHHLGKYQAHEVIQNHNEIKTGDYGRLRVDVTDNSPSQSPGIYINPVLFSLDRAGPQIISNGPDAEDVFGNEGGVAGAPTGEPQMTAKANGVPYSEFIRQGWQRADIIAQGYAVEPAPVAPPPTTVPQAPQAAVAAPPPPNVVPAHDLIPNHRTPAQRMLPTAGGATYESFIQGGWTEAQMIAQGYMSAS